MNIVFIRKDHGQSKTFSMNGKRIAAALLLLVLLFISAVMVGYYAASYNEPSLLTSEMISRWDNEIQNQKQQVEEQKEISSRKVDALSVRMGELQARLLRLEGLGERLTQMADLDKSEFDFGAVSGMGGPSDMLDEYYQAPTLKSALDQLQDRIADRQQQIEVLHSLLSDREFKKDIFLAGRPIKKGWMSSRFGKRRDPFHGRIAWHAGVDFAGKDGSDIISVAAGVVTWASKRYGYGQLVEINHGNGYSTRYAHCKEIVVKVGDVVDKNQTIALMGSTGRSTGPHVHFEVLKNNRQVDPARFIYRASR
jgi:murein DD-endopeptidase MepM/ murein hydrolase activator NlpD